MNKNVLSCLALWSTGALVTFGGGVDKQVTVAVTVLESGTPLSNVTVKGGFEQKFDWDRGVSQTVLTDTNGQAQVSAESSRGVSIKVKKSEYYDHYEKLDLYNAILEGTVSTNRTIELKKIQNPISMYVKYVGEFVPEDGIPVGYDLEKGDWIAPHGEGKYSDVLFKTEFAGTDRKNYEVHFCVEFPGKFNGIQPMYSSYSEGQGSRLRSDYLAPIDGYQQKIEYHGARKEGRSFFKTPYDGEVAGYYFRIRTVLDENGNIKSAQYGKIYGDFKYGRRFDTKTNFTFLYYYNPDKTRSVEFDPNQNLFLKNSKGRPKSCYSIRNP